MRQNTPQMTHPVTMYSTTWCGYCRRLKRQFEENHIPYREVDVDEHRHLGDRIVEATGCYRIVPTVEVEGRLLVNPTVIEVKEALAAG